MRNDKLILLFDFFGELLTKKQREYFDFYYNEDLSLAEIAENEGITRQGVRDMLVRAERTLLDIEEKTGVVQRFLEYRKDAEQLESIAAELADREDTRDLSVEIATIAARLRE